MQSLATFSDSSVSNAELVLLHANGFPPGTYNSFLSEISDAGRILTLEHRPLWQAHAPRFLDYSVYADDAIASIRTEGLIGDRYVSIDPGGGSDELLQPGGTITDTESPTDIQDLISKYAFGDVEK